jgi:hypothetical protein
LDKPFSEDVPIEHLNVSASRRATRLFICQYSKPL